MKLWMRNIALGCTLAMVVCAFWYAAAGSGAALAAAITFGTTGYHFGMRLAVGWVFDRTVHNNLDPSRPWFRPRPWEKPVYEALRVRQWKKHLPTMDPASFDLGSRTWQQLAQAASQAELVHETIAALSFLPLVMIPIFGEAGVFVTTSLVAAAIDMQFVILQRYNRPRFLRLAAKTEKSSLCS